MHITLETDYAIRIVHCLAKAEKRMDAKNIAESTGVTLRFSLKILRKLVAGGIVCSFKGTQGGYEMAKPAGQVSLYDVVQIVEGPFYMSRCMEEGFVCTRDKEGPCKVQRVFQELSQTVKERLSAVTFDQVL